MAGQAFQFYVGIDWASDSYQVCVVDGNGKVLGEKQVEHSGDGIRECIDWLLKLAGGDARSVAVAIEVPRIEWNWMSRRSCASGSCRGWSRISKLTVTG